MTLHNVLLIGAFVCFCLAAAGVNGRVQTGWLGAALASGAFLFT